MRIGTVSAPAYLRGAGGMEPHGPERAVGFHEGGVERNIWEHAGLGCEGGLETAAGFEKGGEGKAARKGDAAKRWNMAKYALISDIHGNFKALEAFFEFIRKHPVDGIISLGDYVTDGPYPERTMELLYEMRAKYPCYMIRGNREDYLLDNVDNKEGWKPSSANGTLYYTSLHLSKSDMAFFASMPTERGVAIQGHPALYICHGTPGRVRGNVQWEEGLKEKILRELPKPYRYLLGGHSHHQETERHGEKTYINPGSLGFAMDGVGRQGQFAVLTGDAEGWDAEFFSIPYNVAAYLQAFTESGVDGMGMTLNKAVKKSLVTGVNYFFKCIQAMEEEAKKRGAGSMAELPETAWEPLVERFGL